jgi:acyl-CoA reductase-like NAD-dependent aldehyde dehydrogenase
MPMFTPLFINGRSAPSRSNTTFEVRNPYSKKVVGTASSASDEDCKVAIHAAVEAFKTWEFTPASQKRDIFLKAAELADKEKYQSKIKLTMIEETAATEQWATFNASLSNMLRSVAGMAHQLKGETLQSVFPGAKLETQRKAMGVMYVHPSVFRQLLVSYFIYSLAIAPWNGPSTLALRAIAIPIICGNTVILRGSEYSPATQAIVVDLLHEAGLPAGVLNFITTSKEDAPAITSMLIGHPAIRKTNVSFSQVVFTGIQSITYMLLVYRKRSCRTHHRS